MEPLTLEQRNNLRVGDRVICLDASGFMSQTPLKVRQVYEVAPETFTTSACTGTWKDIRVVGVDSSAKYSRFALVGQNVAQAGDRVKCIDPNRHIVLGETYTVSEVTFQSGALFYRLEEVPGSYALFYTNRFEKVSEEDANEELFSLYKALRRQTLLLAREIRKKGYSLRINGETVRQNPSHPDGEVLKFFKDLSLAGED